MTQIISSVLDKESSNRNELTKKGRVELENISVNYKTRGNLVTAIENTSIEIIGPSLG